jgi:putative endonuclease
MKISTENYYVYILTNRDRSVLYTGVTNNLPQRIIEHYLNKGNTDTFTGKYACYLLVYYETFKYVNDAIVREKELKKFRRKQKLALIDSFNPEWKFLNGELFDKWPPDDLYHRKDL